MLVENRIEAIGIKPKQKSVESERMEKIFKDCPLALKAESQEISTLREYTYNFLADSSKRLRNTYNFVNDVAQKGGFDEMLIKPDVLKMEDSFTPFNIFIIPKIYLGNLNDLLFSALPVSAGKIVKRGTELIIEQQATLKKGNAFEKVIEIYKNKEEAIKLNNKKNSIFDEVDEINLQNKKIFIFIGQKIDHTAGEELKNASLYDEAKKIEIEKENLVNELPVIMREQWVKDIKENPKRNLIDDISIVETFLSILELGGVNGTQIGDDKVGRCLRGLYPKLNTSNVFSIVNNGNEIRQDLIKSY